MTDETIGRRVARYFSEGVGKDGATVPARPELSGFWAFIRPIFWGSVVICILSFSIALFPLLIADPMRTPELAMRVVLGSFFGALGISSCLVVVAAIFWRWTRRQFGRSQEAEVRAWPRHQFDDAIENSEWEATMSRGWKHAQYRRYIAWLYMERQRTHGVPIPDRIREDVDSRSSGAP
ncbi:hypothetical protein [Phenylobacterium sp.]|uniref:hypothetical protein n=1 Tax=Phenylobacterium sp. TaxID=1871053 RepID=UPI0030038D90